jgi:exopolysaccharide production protein ExoZ
LLNSIQILRAFAAISVVCAHLPSTGRLTETFEYGSIGVDVFFVISGFIMVYSSVPLFESRRGPRIFLANRIARIVPIYWSMTMAWLVLARVDVGFGELMRSLLFFPWDHNGVPVYGIGWTLNYEMFFYVIFAGTLLFGRRTSAAVITAGFAALVGLGQTRSLPLPWSYWANPIILEFVMGVWLAIFYVEGLRLPRPLCIALIVAGVGLFALGYLHEYNIGLQVGHSLIPRAAGWGVPALLIVAGSILPSQPKEPGPIGRHLANIGDASYAIYLFQVIAIMGLWRLPHPMAGAFKQFLANCYDTVVALAGIVLVSIAIHNYFERPITKALKKLLCPTTQPNSWVRIKPPPRPLPAGPTADMGGE